MANKYKEFSQVGTTRAMLKRLHACEQKAVYDTEEMARLGWSQVVYCCCYCGKWHRASNVPRRVLQKPSLIKGKEH